MVWRYAIGEMEFLSIIAAMDCQIYRGHTSFRRIIDYPTDSKELGQISLRLVVLKVLVYGAAEDSLASCICAANITRLSMCFP